MTEKVIVGPRARRDLDKLTLWYSAEAGADVALRFVESSHEAFTKLAETPGLGPSLVIKPGRLDALRKWRVPGFANILILYRPRREGVSIVRVIHGAQDWWALLDVS